MTTLVRYDGLVVEQLPARAKSWRSMNGAERERHQAGRITHAKKARLLLRPDHIFSDDVLLVVGWRGEPELIRAVQKRNEVLNVWSPARFIKKATTMENIVDLVVYLLDEYAALTYVDSDPAVCKAVAARAPLVTVIQMRVIRPASKDKEKQDGNE